MPGLTGHLGRDNPARLVHAARLAQREQVLGLLQGDFLLPFGTASGKEERALDGQEPFVVADAHAHRPAAVMGQIPLADAVRLHRLRLESVVQDEELLFGFYVHSYMSQADMSRPAARPSRISVEEMSMRGAFNSSMR